MTASAVLPSERGSSGSAARFQAESTAAGCSQPVPSNKRISSRPCEAGRTATRTTAGGGTSPSAAASVDPPSRTASSNATTAGRRAPVHRRRRPLG